MPKQRMQQRRDPSAVWAEFNPVLLDGEIGIDSDLDRYKIGDGIASWSVLPFADRLEDSQVAVADARAAQAAAEQARDQAVDISNISTSDDVVSALVRDRESDTSHDLSASFAQVIDYDGDVGADRPSDLGLVIWRKWPSQPDNALEDDWVEIFNG